MLIQFSPKSYIKVEIILPHSEREFNVMLAQPLNIILQNINITLQKFLFTLIFVHLARVFSTCTLKKKNTHKKNPHSFDCYLHLIVPWLFLVTSLRANQFGVHFKSCVCNLLAMWNKRSILTGWSRLLEPRIGSSSRSSAPTGQIYAIRSRRWR